MGRELPPWAVRIRRERELRGWSQRDAVRALQSHARGDAAGVEALLRRWKAWEAGDNHPDEHYQRLLAVTFGTPRGALFPGDGRTVNSALAAAGMDTLELVGRVRSSDVDTATLDGLAITVEQLCSDYPHRAPEALAAEGREWLRRVAELRDGRLTLDQHREVLGLAGWLALLVGCLEYDVGYARRAEATRRAALSLGAEAGHGEIQAWAHEMRAWFALTSGDYRGVITAAQAGADVAGGASVAAQLAGQEAKAWARMGDRRQVELALDRGRRLLDALPYPDNIANHFVVDPAKFDVYAMDCYRLVGEDATAAHLADEVLRTMPNAPMRRAEASVTLGVVAARDGDLEQAVHHGATALNGERKSLPALLLVSRELASIVAPRRTIAPAAREYLDRLRSLRPEMSTDS